MSWSARPFASPFSFSPPVWVIFICSLPWVWRFPPLRSLVRVFGLILFSGYICFATFSPSGSCFFASFCGRLGFPIFILGRTRPLPFFALVLLYGFFLGRLCFFSRVIVSFSSFSIGVSVALFFALTPRFSCAAPPSIARVFSPVVSVCACSLFLSAPLPAFFLSFIFYALLSFFPLPPLPPPAWPSRLYGSASFCALCPFLAASCVACVSRLRLVCCVCVACAAFASLPVAPRFVVGFFFSLLF